MYNKTVDRVCPSCGDTLSPSAKYCGCGWGLRKGKSDVAQKPLDPQCAYETAGDRCNYPGGISFGVKGEGPWFCRIHAHSQGNREATQALHDSNTYRQEQGKEDFEWLKEKFPKDQFETLHEYQMRCKNFALSKLQDFGLKKVMVDL